MQEINASSVARASMLAELLADSARVRGSHRFRVAELFVVAGRHLACSMARSGVLESGWRYGWIRGIWVVRKKL
jgi:hypothetical protein